MTEPKKTAVNKGDEVKELLKNSREILDNLPNGSAQGLAILIAVFQTGCGVTVEQARLMALKALNDAHRMIYTADPEEVFQAIYGPRGLCPSSKTILQIAKDGLIPNSRHDGQLRSKKGVVLAFENYISFSERAWAAFRESAPPSLAEAIPPINSTLAERVKVGGPIAQDEIDRLVKFQLEKKEARAETGSGDQPKSEIEAQPKNEAEVRPTNEAEAQAAREEAYRIALAEADRKASANASAPIGVSVSNMRRKG